MVGGNDNDRLLPPVQLPGVGNLLSAAALLADGIFSRDHAFQNAEFLVRAFSV